MDKFVDQGLYVISVAARLAAVHPQTLRTYERKGLLTPSRTPKNRRRYSEADIERLRRIQHLTQDEGLNLSGVRKVLAMEDEMVELSSQIERLKHEVEEAKSRLMLEVRELKRHSALSMKPPTSLARRRRGA